MIELWSNAVQSIEAHVQPAYREQWLRPIKCVAIQQGHIRLRAPNRYHKEWFEDNYLGHILQDLERRTSGTFKVDFEIGDEDQPAADVPAVASGVTAAPAEAPPVRVPGLETRYDFDKFVVGPSNQFAHAAARMVANSPGSKMNPLFIYGGVGLGKTHLLHAIGHEIHSLHPAWKVTVITCERFVTDFIGSMMNQKRGGGPNLMEEFRRRYREDPDVLLVDDIQFLSNKAGTQDEFFHTFNALHQAHKQIVVTCDKLAAEVPALDERLRSRFTWGLTAGIEAPDLETRVAILKRKAQLDGIDLPNEVALMIGSQVKSNVRELEGALLHIATRSAIANRPVSCALAEEALRTLVARSPSGLTVEAIQRAVASYFDVKVADLRGLQRHRAIAHPRMVAMYLSRKLTSTSYPEIGNRFGGKDHSTVIAAVRKIERLLTTDPCLRSVITTLDTSLRQG
jgi:chromosomal replication initiator protein